jgi:uncharacterized protein
MRDPLPESIDPRRLAGAASELSGIWPAARCQRILGAAERLLSDVLVDFNVIKDAGQYLKFDGRIRVELELRCQRCLQVMPWKLDESFRLLLVPQGRVAPENDGYEELELDENGHIDTAVWIEQEIILRIPGIPVHSRTRDCDPEMLQRAREFDETVKSKKDNPFKVLEGWKGD